MFLACRGTFGWLGASALFSPRPFGRDWMWAGPEEGVRGLLGGVSQRRLGQCLHGCFRAAPCEIGELLYGFLGVGGP